MMAFIPSWTRPAALAQKGYRLTASDISEGEIEKAQREAAQQNLDVDFHFADMRTLAQTFQVKFDLVIACDNAIPHLLSDKEIVQAFRQFYQVKTDAGGCLISVRDYDSMERGGRKLYPRTVHDVPDGKIVIFDCWEFDGDFYDITMYIVEDLGRTIATTHIIRGGRYYCVSLSRLEKLMKDAGFEQVIPLKERYFQPLLIGLKA